MKCEMCKFPATHVAITIDMKTGSSREKRVCHRHKELFLREAEPGVMKGAIVLSEEE